MRKARGILEIDETRGVIYFTPTSGPRKGATLLRICGIIPELGGATFIDIAQPKLVMVTKEPKCREKSITVQPANEQPK